MVCLRKVAVAVSIIIRASAHHNVAENNKKIGSV